MPPDPVLGLLSALGLFVYSTIGCATGLWVKKHWWQGVGCTSGCNDGRQSGSCYHGEHNRDLPAWAVLAGIFWVVIPLGFLGKLIGMASSYIGRTPFVCGQYLFNALDKGNS